MCIRPISWGGRAQICVCFKCFAFLLVKALLSILMLDDDVAELLRATASDTGAVAQYLTALDGDEVRVDLFSQQSRASSAQSQRKARTHEHLPQKLTPRT